MANEKATINLFELATKQKLRFESVKGLLTTEQLWDLPLSSRDGFNLDAVAKEANKSLKDAGEESFVATKTNPAKAAFELKLEIVKHIIADKMAAIAKAEQLLAKRQERTRLLDLLDKKNNDELAGLSKEEILKRLEATDED